MIAAPQSLDGRTLLIAGRWHAADTTFERRDPARPDTVTGRFAAAHPGQVADAFAAAAAAQPAWAAVTAPARGDILHRAAALLEERLDAATHRVTCDMGKARRDARAEVVRSAQILRYFAGEQTQPSGGTYPSADPSTLLMTLEEPVGVVCAITPWNFPLAIPAWKLAPALGFGNAVVWKPAESASGSAVLLAQVLQDAGLPPGVLNVVTGHGRDLSAALTGDPHLGAITFTGSGGVGMRLRAATADRLVKVQLELGGKNPAVVLADADLEDAATQIARGAMLSTGQRCTATSRVYVDRAVAVPFLERLRTAVEGLVVGDPSCEETDVGPVASQEQHETITRYLHLARAEGATFVTGGAALDGCYVAPTVLTGVRDGSALVREEIFGPVLVVTEVVGYADALHRSNDTEFGLSSAVFTRDLRIALDFVRASRSGLVHVNRETAGVEPHVPFGGLKGSSSLDREQGKAARSFFTTTKTAYVRSV